MLLVSTVQQSESDTHTHIYTHTYTPSLSQLPPIPSSHPSRSWQSPELSSLGYTTASPPAISHVAVYNVSGTPNSSNPLPPSCPQNHSLCLHLYSYPTNRFVTRSIFLDFIYMCYIYIFFFFWLRSLCKGYFELLSCFHWGRSMRRNALTTLLSFH